MSNEGEPEPQEPVLRLAEALRLAEQQLAKALQDVEDLREAQERRYVIERAKGMLMARSAEMSADDAFEMLVTASQRENVKVRDIAQRIVDRRPVSEKGTRRPRTATRPPREQGSPALGGGSRDSHHLHPTQKGQGSH